MAGLPITYRKSSENALATYSFEDIVGGVGILQLYGAMVSTSGGDDYILTTNSGLLSNDIFTNDNASATGETIDITFTITFQKTVTLGGETLFNIPVRIKSSAVTAGVMNVDVIVKKNTSTLVSVTTENLTSGSAAENITKVFCTNATIPKTTFKAGDELNIQYEVNLTLSSGTCDTSIAHDPAGRDGTIFTADDVNTRLVTLIPVDIDL